MNPTAEDILNKHLREDLPKGKNVVLTYVETRHLLAAMEEYSLLKSKEAASEAWDAGYNDAKYLREDEFTKNRKETFMKELFKPVTI
jgi:hypothetical protein